MKILLNKSKVWANTRNRISKYWDYGSNIMPRNDSVQNYSDSRFYRAYDKPFTFSPLFYSTHFFPFSDFVLFNKVCEYIIATECLRAIWYEVFMKEPFPRIKLKKKDFHWYEFDVLTLPQGLPLPLFWLFITDYLRIYKL